MEVPYSAWIKPANRITPSEFTVSRFSFEMTLVTLASKAARGAAAWTSDADIKTITITTTTKMFLIAPRPASCLSDRQRHVTPQLHLNQFLTVLPCYKAS